MSVLVPTIETERLILRDWTEEDVDAVAAILTDREAANFIGGVAPSWHPFRAVCTFIGHWQLRGFGFFALERKEEGDCIGWAGMWRPDGWPDNEIGYSLAKSVWGMGYATEAVEASLRFAYEAVGWKTAISLIDNKNTASQNVARKMHAILEKRDVQVTDFVADIWRHQPAEKFLARTAPEASA